MNLVLSKIAIDEEKRVKKKRLGRKTEREKEKKVAVIGAKKARQSGVYRGPQLPRFPF